jgi:hypothetical protein
MIKGSELNRNGCEMALLITKVTQRKREGEGERE